MENRNPIYRLAIKHLNSYFIRFGASENISLIEVLSKHFHPPEARIETPIGSFVSFSDVYPDEILNLQELPELLKRLDFSDALLFCVRLNHMLSPHGDARQFPNWYTRERITQRELTEIVFCEPELSLIRTILDRRARVAAIFRGQLLEMMTFIARFCPTDGGLKLINASAKKTFAKAMLIATEAWSESIYGGKLTNIKAGADAARELLGPFRMAWSENAPGLGPLAAVARGYRIFDEHLPRFLPSFNRLFHGSTGLTIRQYYFCLYCIYGISALAKGDFSLTSLVEMVPSVAPSLDAFLDLVGQTREDLRCQLMMNHGPRWITERRILGYKPILRIGDDRLIVLDFASLAQICSIGPLFQARHVEIANRAFDALGKAFEEYCLEMLSDAYGAGPISLLTIRPMAKSKHNAEEEIADAFVRYSDVLLWIEVKAVFLRDDKLAESPESLRDHIKTKYVVDGRSKKGIAQIASNIKRCLGSEVENTYFDRVRRIIPLLIVRDELLDSPLNADMLAEEFAKLLSDLPFQKDLDVNLETVRVSRLVVMTIDDLEQLESSLQGFTLLEFLQDYLAASSDQVLSVRNYMISSKYYRKLILSKRILENYLQFSKMLRSNFLKN